MSNDEPFEKGPGSGIWAFVRRYIRFSGLDDWSTLPRVRRFNITGLLTALISGFILSWATGLIGWINGIVDAASNGAQFLTESISSLIGAVFGVNRVISLAVAGTQLEVSRGGLAAFALAIATVGLAAYILNLGVSQLE